MGNSGSLLDYVSSDFIVAIITGYTVGGNRHDAQIDGNWIKLRVSFLGYAGRGHVARAVARQPRISNRQPTAKSNSLKEISPGYFGLFCLKGPELIRLTYLAYIYRKPSSPKLRIQLHELIDGFIGDHSVGDIAVNFRIIELGGGFGILAILLFEYADLLQ